MKPVATALISVCLATAAHGVTTGAGPGEAAIALMVLLGVAAGSLATRVVSARGMAALLLVVQGAGHVLLGLTPDPHMDHHESGTNSATMLCAHLGAAAVCGALIVVATHLASVVGRVVRAAAFLIARSRTAAAPLPVTARRQRATSILWTRCQPRRGPPPYRRFTLGVTGNAALT